MKFYLSLASAFLFTLQFSLAQSSLNLDYVKETKDDSKAIGLNFQYLLRTSSYSLPGLNTGVYYEESVQNGKRLQIPLNLQYRYYLLGAQSCSGGIYTELSGGAIASFPLNKSDRTEVSNTISPQATCGIGIYIPIGIDLNFRFGSQYSDKTFRPFWAIKVGYIL